MQHGRASWLGIAAAALLLAVAAAGCHDDQGPAGCSLQMMVLAQPPSVAVGDTVGLSAHALPMLPPGRGCGAATVTWSLSDSALASIASTGPSTAVLRALQPGVVLVTADGTAAGHEDIESVDVTITAAP